MADPSSLFGADLVAWFKADAGTSTTTDGNPISQWNDQSGNSHNLAQASGSLQPLYKAAIQNGMPVVRFDGSNDYLQVAFTQALPVEVFAVGAYKAAFGGAAVFLCSQVNTNRMMFYRSASTNMIFVNGLTQTMTGVTPETWHEWDAYYDSATSSRFEMDYNGSPVTGADGTGAPGGLTVGCNVAGAQASQIDVGEIVIVKRAASTPERAQMNYYFANRWAIPNNSGITGFVPRVMVY
jgi:hypothetical protein